MKIWQCESYNASPKQAIEWFCNEYWDKPRKPRKIRLTGNITLFQITGGTGRDYICQRNDKELPSLYEIHVDNS